MDSKKSKDKSSELLSVTSLEPCHPSAIFMKVHLDEQGRLIWPVMFVYPEYGQTDFIQNFNEEDKY